MTEEGGKGWQDVGNKEGNRKNSMVNEERGYYFLAQEENGKTW